MTTTRTEENTYDKQEKPHPVTTRLKHPQNKNDLQSPPKKYGLFALTISYIIDFISSFFISFAAIKVLIFYFNTLPTLFKSNSNAVNVEDFTFEVSKPKDFINKSYYIDKSIETTINTGLKCSNEINNIEMQKNQSKDLFRRIEELNRQRFILISGEPGTGKTFTTKTILGKLPNNYRIINIVPSALKSKYLGESPKRLASIFKYITFHHNGKANLKFIVFFDECDSLLETDKEHTGRDSLINQFLLIAGGDDKIKRLPFVCIFTTNANVHQIMERGHRRFTHVTPAVMTKDSLETIFKNYAEDHEVLKDITDFSDFCEVFKNQVLQFPLDFLKRVCECKNGNVVDNFREEIKKEMEKKEKIFNKAFEELNDKINNYHTHLKLFIKKVERLSSGKEKTWKNRKEREHYYEVAKRELQAICVEFRRINSLARVNENTKITEMKGILESFIKTFRITDAKMKKFLNC